MRTRDLMRLAKKDGSKIGTSAGNSCFDGNTEDATYRKVLRGIENGDPRVYDMFNSPHLSGEWAGDTTPQSLASDYRMKENDERLDYICTVWEESANDAFWAEIERVCRYMTIDEDLEINREIRRER